MKKTIIIFIVIFGCSCILEAQSFQKPEHVYKHYTYADIFNNDTITEEMTLEGTFHYNIQDLVSSYECYIEYGSYGNEYYRKNYWYDNDAHIIKYSYTGYDGGGIYGDDTIYYVYDNNLLSYTLRLYVNKWGGWYYTDSVAYQYYDNGALWKKEQYGSNPDDLNWPSSPFLVTEFVYNETEVDKTKIETRFRNGNLDYRKTSQYDLNDNTTAFLYEGYNGYSYLREGYSLAYAYENGLCQNRTRQNWIMADSCWVNDSHLVFNYNNLGMKTGEVAQTWADGQWRNVQRTSWEVDEDGIIHSITYEVWTDSLFVNSRRVEYHYDENGLCTSMDGLVWYEEEWVHGMAGINGIGGSNERIFWDESLSFEDDLIRATSHNFTTTTITWQTLYLGVEEKEKTTENGFMVYPNPANTVLFVETQCFASQPTATAYRITNPMGQTLLQGNVTAETQQINIESLPAGLYFISVGNVTQKFVVK